MTVANKGITGTSGSSAKAAGILAAAFGHGGLDGAAIDAVLASAHVDLY